MGLINWLMHRGIRNQAEELARWAMDSYKKVKKQNLNLSDRETYGKILDLRFRIAGGEEGRAEVLDRYGSSLHGLCYYAGLNSPSMQHAMVVRCLQFTEYVDLALKKQGADQLPLETKKQYFRYLKLPEDVADQTRL